MYCNLSDLTRQIILTQYEPAMPVVFTSLILERIAFFKSLAPELPQ